MTETLSPAEGPKPLPSAEIVYLQAPKPKYTIEQQAIKDFFEDLQASQPQEFLAADYPALSLVYSRERDGIPPSPAHELLARFGDFIRSLRRNSQEPSDLAENKVVHIHRNGKI